MLARARCPAVHVLERKIDPIVAVGVEGDFHDRILRARVGRVIDLDRKVTDLDEFWRPLADDLGLHIAVH